MFPLVMRGTPRPGHVAPARAAPGGRLGPMMGPANNTNSGASRTRSRRALRIGGLAAGAPCALAAPACQPIVAGPGYFGVGFYSARAPEVSERSNTFEIRGVGALFVSGRMILGYADVAGLCCSPGETDLHVAFERAHVYIGGAADAEAIRMGALALERATPGAATHENEAQGGNGL